MAETTRGARRRTARELLVWRFGGRPLRIREITARDLVKFVTFRARALRPMSVKVLSDSLRSFLRFLHLEGHCPKSLDLAVPTLHGWNRANLPTVIDGEKLRRFLGSFDRSTPIGRRDYAMALCMSELGLRVSEVAQMSLEDLHKLEPVTPGTLIPVRRSWPHCQGPGLTLLEFGHDSQTTLRVFDHGRGEFATRPNRGLHCLLSAIAMSGIHTADGPEGEPAGVISWRDSSSHDLTVH